MEYKSQKMGSEDMSFHAMEDDVIATPVNFSFRLKDDEIVALGPVNPINRPINISLAYKLIIPPHKNYRFIYNYHWDAHDGNYIGLYNVKADHNLPMYIYYGGEGFGPKSIVVQTGAESLEYIVHGHWAKSFFGGRLPWVQLPAILQFNNKQILFEKVPDSNASDRVGWITWYPY